MSVFRSNERGSSPRRRWLIAAGLLIAAVVAAALLRVGSEPQIEISTDVPGIGKSTRVTATISEPRRGVGDATLELVQGDLVTQLSHASHPPRPFWALWGPKTKTVTLEAVAEGGKIEGLSEGEATLRVRATRAGTWFRRPDPVVLSVDLPVRLRPPTLSVLSDLIYVSQGGSEVVVYRIGDGAIRDGVMSGDDFFPGYPLPGGGEGERFALFAVPYDVDDSARVRLQVEDALGNKASASFLDRFKPRPPRQSTIRLSDGFFDKVVPEILARSPEIAERETPLESYLAINGELREINGLQLRELAAASRQEFTWRRPFLQQRNTQVTDSFAAQRTYLYNDQPVDEQVHLGYDLASVKRAPIEASNRGWVALARYFGIYGNAVVIDHGYGLMTLYGHLSSIEVEPGQEVQRGQTVGRSGETGLAGGDHLHFTILLQGEPVDPIEWFDVKWIRDRLVRKLGPALDFES